MLKKFYLKIKYYVEFIFLDRNPVPENPGFVTLGQKLGAPTLFKYIKNFGFGFKTGIDLNGESSGIIFKESQIGPVELATTAFGQGVSVTPLQQITAVSAAINGGYLYKPYVVKSINEPETNSVIKNTEKTLVRKVISNDTSKKVRYALESVVSNGTGRTAYIDGYRVGGKTGTAQKVSNGKYLVNNYILSFIGFLPANNPKVIVYVAIDNPKGVNQYGGVIAGPIAKEILTDATHILNIKKPSGGTEKKYNYTDKKYVTVPNVIGMTKDKAASELKKFKIDIVGSGNKVAYQSPKENERIYEGETVRIFMG